MAVLRLYPAVKVSDVDRSVLFYAALLGDRPEEVRPGYAKLSVADPALNFTLSEGSRAELGALHHAAEC